MSVLVLSEDGAKNSPDVIRALCLAIFKELQPGVRTNQIAFDPPNTDARAAVSANKWKSRNPRDQAAITRLVRTIAGKLAESRGFVVFHIDADQTWNTKRQPENLLKFTQIILKKVEATLRASSIHRKPRDLSGSQVSALLSRLRIMMPYYSIESWLYQNTAKAIEHCAARCGMHISLIEKWGQERGLLDEVSQPKDALCLGGSCNLELATDSWPLTQIVKAKKSLNKFYESLYECEGLGEALAATYASPSTSPDS